MRRGWLLVLFAIASAWAPAFAEGPQPPCGGSIFPQIPQVGEAPAVKVWPRDATWTPPVCTGWTEAGYGTLVVLAGRFRVAGGGAALVERIGAISKLQGVRYWSTTQQRWETLITSAGALTGANGARRKDFGREELAAGSTVYFEQEDNLGGRAVYQLKMRKAGAEGIVFETENVTPISLLFVTMFGAGDVRTVYWLEREQGEVWRCWVMTRIGVKANALAAGRDGSWTNRAVALYRHLAGMRTDEEPPAAR